MESGGRMIEQPPRTEPNPSQPDGQPPRGKLFFLLAFAIVSATVFVLFALWIGKLTPQSIDRDVLAIWQQMVHEVGYTISALIVLMVLRAILK
jgi:hypothetical protein